MSPVGGQQGFDNLESVAKGLAQVPACLVSGVNDLAQGDRRPRQFLTDGSAQETVVVKDPYFGDITRIVPEDDRLANVCRQRGVQIALPHKSDPIATHGAWLSHGQQQQVQLLERVRRET